MNNLLVLDTSPRKDAVSRSLTEGFISAWGDKFSDASIVHRDIGANPPEHIDDELIDGLRRDPDHRQRPTNGSDRGIGCDDC